MEESMARLGRVLSAAVILGAGAALIPGSAHAQGSARPESTGPAPTAVTRVARLSAGTIAGLVIDERGGPVAGARVTAIGATMALTFTDENGQFITESLPAGEYVVRAHRSGFSASKRAIVNVGAAAATVPQLELRRLDATAGTTGTTAPPLPSRPIIAAGFSLPEAETSDAASAEEAKPDGHPHSETAWRLRHIKRSILKDRSNAIELAGNDPDFGDASLFGRAVGGAANVAGYATSFLADLSLNGEVNLLTTSVFGPGELFSGEGLPRGVAYLALGAPTPAGDWTVRAAMSEGDLASWIVAGSFVSKVGRSHAYTVGLSYSTQDYQGGNPIALAAMRDGSRNAAEVHAFDRWRMAPWFELDYGARYAHYDYIKEGGLLSPRMGFTIEPVKGTRMSALVTQRMVVPGAEEFLPRAITGPALPPERTFAPLEGSEMRVERARGLELMLEHQFGDAYVVGIRRFHQRVDDQLATMFRLAPAGSPESMGHYYVGTAGSFDATGWGLRISSPPALRVRGAVDYSVARANWTSLNPDLGAMAPALVRPESEDIHDITTSFETDIPETATRFYLLYRVNTAFTRASNLSRPGMDARFDMQVNQALPFGVAGTKWEVLVGLRNLFRDASDPASIYDELLVVRPPKRVIGGFLVRF
jgi:hypothetical protein